MNCIHRFYPETYLQPAEWCMNGAEEGSEWCEDHNPDRWEPDWDAYADDMWFEEYGARIPELAEFPARAAH